MKKIVIIIFALITLAACSKKEIFIGQNWGSEAAGYKVGQDYPEWISNPSLGVYIAAVGRGKSNIRRGLKTQKNIARTIARGRIIRRINILVNNVCNGVTTETLEKEIIETYRPQIDCGQAYVGVELLKKIVVKKEWKDPKRGDYYIWMILKK